MAAFRVVTEEELRPALEILNGLEWPVPFEDVPEIFPRLGWELQRRKGGRTDFPVSLPLVSVGELHGELSRIEFRISDTLPGTDAGDQRIVAAAFPEAVRVVATCLGAEPTGRPWVTPGARWELDGGRQLNLLQGDTAIKVQLWSKRMADIERGQRRHGVDPGHDLDDVE